MIFKEITPYSGSMLLPLLQWILTAVFAVIQKLPATVYV